MYCLKQIDRKNRRIQNESGETMKNAEIIQLLDLQNSLVYFSTSLTANERVHEKLSKVEAVKSNEDYEDLYDDVSIENKQAIETCNIYKNILSVTMDAYGSMISNNSNDSMRKLTIITILLAVPTMIAGILGNEYARSVSGRIRVLADWVVLAGCCGNYISDRGYCASTYERQSFQEIQDKKAQKKGTARQKRQVNIFLKREKENRKSMLQ